MPRSYRPLMLTFLCGLTVGAVSVRFAMRPTSMPRETTDPAELALSKTVPSLRIDKTKLPDALHKLSEVWGIPIHFDDLPQRQRFMSIFADGTEPEENSGEERYPKVSIHAKDVTLADALHWVLISDDRFMGYEVRNGAIEVSTQADAFVRAYDIHDLVAVPAPSTVMPAAAGGGGGQGLFGSGPSTPQPIPLTPGATEVAILETLTNPGGNVTGGVCRIGNSLVVYDTWDNHRNVVRILDRIRHPEPIPAHAEVLSEIRVWDSARKIFINPDPNDRQLSRLLSTRVGPLHLKDVLIEDALEVLRDRWKVTIYVDRPEIDRAHVNWDDHVSAELQNPTLSEALRVVLGDYGVTPRIGFYLDDQTLVVTSEAHVYKGVATRIYRLGDWVDRCDPAALLGVKTFVAAPAGPVGRLIGYVQAEVDADSWSKGDLRIAEFHGLLIVTQTWSNLEEIDRLLARLKAMTDEADAPTH